MHDARGPPIIDPLLKELARVEKYGLLEDPLLRSIARLVGHGLADERDRGMLAEALQGFHMREVFGQIPPFREPQPQEGELVLGASTSGRQIRSPLQTLGSGSLFVMPTGEGKTNYLRFLTPQIAANSVPVWIFEQSKRESRHLLPLFPPGERGLVILNPQNMDYDPLHPGNCDLRRHLSNISNSLRQGLGLGDRSLAVLYQVLDYLFQKFGNWDGRTDAHPNCFDVYELVKDTSGILPAVRESILDRMVPMLLEMKAWRLGRNPADLLRHNICFEMAGAPHSLQHVIPESLITSVFQAEIEQGSVNAALKLLVVFEDAQAYAQPDPGGGMTILDIAAGTVRGAGIGVCLSVQTMEGLSRKLVPNLSGLKVMGRPGSNDDAWRIGSDMGMDREQIDWIKHHTGKGIYVARTLHWPEPFVLRVPLVPTPRQISDEEAEASVRALDHLPTVPASEYDDWRPHYIIRVRPAAEEQEETSPTDQRGISDRVSKEELDYLESVARIPFLGATQRDQSLGLSSWKGNKLRGHLLKKCLVSAVHISPGGRGRRFQLLELTEHGRQVLNSYGIHVSSGHGRGGIEHQWWVHRISEWLRSKDIPATIEDESLGARADISVRSQDGHVAIEVEVSRGHEMENIRKDLDAGFSTVVSLLKGAREADKLRARLVKEVPTKIPRIRVGNLDDFADTLEGVVCFGGG